MPESRMKVLFISHDASRTGAPFVLLHFLRWLKEHSDIEFEVLLRNGGELHGEFSALCRTYLWNADSGYAGYVRKYLNLLNKSTYLLDGGRRRLVKQISGEGFDLIFANSVASCEVVTGLKKRCAAPVICYLHELEMSIVQYCGLDVFREASRFIDLFIGSSAPVVGNLIANHHIPESKTDLIYDYVPAKKYHDERSVDVRREMRGMIGVADDVFVVGSSGTTDWRKGFDLIPQIARMTREKNGQKILFLWIGGYLKGVEYERIMYDIERLGLANRVKFVEYDQRYFEAIDAFLLSSREDPFPLVCLQAASLEKPVICFDKSGGMPEFVNRGCGYVIPYIDIDAAAEKIIYLANNPSVARRLGETAAEKAIEFHDVGIAGVQLINDIRKVAHGARKQ
jgi:glycosyltransferase involved in cell wall biosynthesis